MNIIKSIFKKQELLQCPCCDYFTLTERSSYEICLVCFWEDDGLDLINPDEHSGPNHQTLREGRTHFKKIGACHPNSVSIVLKPNKRSRYKFQPRKLK